MKIRILFLFLLLLSSLLSAWTILANEPIIKPISPHILSTDAVSLNQEIASGTLELSALTRWYTPMFYLEDFPRYFWWGTGGALILDDWQQIDPTETILFPKSVVHVQKILPKNGYTLLEVTSKEYPYDSDPHYIDARLLQVYQVSTPLRKRIIVLPTRTMIINRLRSQVGKPYVWWGNALGWVPYLETLYRPQHTLDTPMRKKWILDGWDCSGILYWATNGYTPRNTSKLITFGTGLEIAGKSATEIAALVKPLDIIVWKWHNMIVIDQKHILESTVNFTGTWLSSEPNGVRIRWIEEALTELIEVKNRIWVNEYSDSVPEGKKKFVIRRWFQ